MKKVVLEVRKHSSKLTLTMMQICQRDIALNRNSYPQPKLEGTIWIRK